MIKCKYYNNSQTACTLMIDDLSGLAVTNNGILSPGNDWGFGLKNKNSLYKYFESNLLNKYPDIKGTVFFATKIHECQNKNAGYKLLKREIDSEFRDFVKKISNEFEFAFHGTTHVKYFDVLILSLFKEDFKKLIFERKN